MDELSNKISGQKSLKRDYKQIINELKVENNPQPRLKEELKILTTEAKNFEEKSKWKEASVVYFEGAMILREFVDKNDNTFKEWVDKSVYGLVSLANEYMAWKEVDRSSAAMAVANLIHFLKGEWSLLPAYNEFNSNFSSLIQTGKTAAQSLWVPYDLVTCISQLNAELLQRAESYAQTSLLTETKITDAFRDVIYTVLADAREAMTSQMKLPVIETTGELPKDIIFSEKFNLSIEVENTGEGIANRVILTINKINGLNIESGSYSTGVESLQPNSKYKFSFTFNCPSGEGEKERKFDIGGKIEYLDILNNRRQNPLGPYSITIRAFKKADELKEALNKLEKSNNDLISKYESIKSSATSSKSFVSSFLEVYNTSKKEIVNYINSGDFNKAESRIDLLGSFMQKIGVSSAELASNHENLVLKSSETRNTLLKINKSSFENLSKTEKLLNDFETKWTK